MYALLVTRSNNFLDTLLALLDSLRLELQTERVELRASPWLPVNIFQSLVKPCHFVDVKINVKSLVKRNESVLKSIALRLFVLVRSSQTRVAWTV